MQKPHLIRIIILLSLPVLAISKPAAARAPYDQAYLRANYDSLRVNIDENREALRSMYLDTLLGVEPSRVIAECEKYVFIMLTDSIFPAWYGSDWGYYGTSHIPGEGKIACGYFVVRTLQDAGFDIPWKMARQPAVNIMKNLAPESERKYFAASTSTEQIASWVKSNGEGLYLLGLTNHIGFLICRDNRVMFCHSSIFPPAKVVSNDIRVKSPLTESSFRVLTKLLDASMMEAWLIERKFEIHYDYFEEREY